MTNKKVELDLTQVNGNAFAILGAFAHQAKREGWERKEIDEVLAEAKSGDYDHLLSVISDHCE